MPKRSKFLVWLGLTVLIYLMIYRLDRAVASIAAH